MPGVLEPRTGLSMGQSTELMAKQWKITRKEQDQLAYESHIKAAAAWREGFYDDLVIEYLGLEERQQRPRRYLDGEAREAAPHFRYQCRGHADRGQQHPAHRWRLGRPAGV